LTEVCGDVMIMQHAMVKRVRKWSNGRPWWWSQRSSQQRGWRNWLCIPELSHGKS